MFAMKLINRLLFFLAACPPPDFPEGGRYEPEKAEYEVGLTINYACNGRLPMFVEDVWIGQHKVVTCQSSGEWSEGTPFGTPVVTCQSSGEWSEGTPFCDTPTKLRDPIVSSNALGSTVLDGDSMTCFQTRSNTNEMLRFSLDGEADVYATILCWKEGFCGINNHKKNAVKTEFITVQVSSDTASSISLCLIEAYVKDDKWCEHPPENSVPNGQLEVSRNTAVLHCKPGFEEKDGREVYATCENKKWSYLSLQCVEAKPQKDHKILACPPPNFPEGGRYEPEKAEYEVGLTINYTCNGRLPMFVEDVWIGQHKVVTCQSSGKWSEGTPFCDTPTKLRNPIVSSDALGSTVLDGDSMTCFQTRNDTDEFLRFSLDGEADVYATMLCWKKGFCGLNNHKKNAVKTEFITVQISSDTASSISLCLIEAYVKDDKWCDHPPENSVPNGQLEVSRNKAVLHCNEGFRVKEGRRVYATCKNNKWSYLSLQCVETLCNPVVGNVNPSEGEWESDDKTSEYSVGTKRTLKCKPGYHSEGEPITMTCLENGTWTRTSATCKSEKILLNTFI
ncbi:hypothetical protein AVEN_161865-1 [Araneus ventricosus]|uniref:Sushi domain-containing protein n=1 Tax=Araneus ventricosus TaxID=182803 RepID=A0A4Y2LPE8_ARAVE|nr:hypothetical protein AVEN_161865-1 [Araneus ventricosus]